MYIGVALPIAVPGTSGPLLMEWARKADAGPFSSVTVLDHTTAESYEPFTVLAAAAALTQLTRLAIILPAGSLRTTPLLARVTTSIDALSQGRLIVGLALGTHPQAYAALDCGWGLPGNQYDHRPGDPLPSQRFSGKEQRNSLLKE